MYTIPMIHSTTNIKEWLPMPRGINTDDSFATELLQQFDKRMNLPTALNTSNNIQDMSESSIDSINESPLSTVEPAMQPTNNNINLIDHSHDHNMNRPPNKYRSINSNHHHHNNTQERRRSSAGDLLKRSSAFFKSTFDHPWKNKSKHHQQEENHKKEKRPISLTLESTTNANHTTSFSSSSSSSTSSSSYQLTPTTIAINTTITIPLKKKPSQPSFALLQPPIISQYPPKPLKYSDVSPNNTINHHHHQDDNLFFPTSLPSADVNHEKPSPSSSHKTLMHRLSMPALRKKVSSFALNAAYNNHHFHRPKSDVVM